MIYRHQRRGRRRANIVTLIIVWGLVLIGLFALHMAWWIAVGIVAFTLTALIEFIRDSCSWVEVWSGRIIWDSALSSGERADIDHVRLDRRFDGGIRITLVHVGGAHTRLPPDIAPPVDRFQDALGAAGIPVERHPFSVF